MTALVPVLLVALAVLAAALLYWSRRPLDLLDPVSYFVLAHLVFLFSGIFWAQRYDSAVILTGQVVLLVACGALCFSLGVFGTDLLLSAHKPPARVEVSAASLDRAFATAAWIIAGLGLAFLAIYGVRAGLVDWFGGGAFDDLRVEVRKGEGKFAVLAIGFVSAGAWLSSAYLLFARRRWLASWLVATIAAGALLTIGNRAPAADLLVVQFFFWCLFRYRRLPAALAAGAALGVLLGVAVLGSLRQGGVFDADVVLSRLLWRPFVNLQNLQWVFDAYPGLIAYEWGGTYVRDLGVLLPGYQPNFGTWLKEALGLRFTGGGLTVTHLGEAFANFGWGGVVAVPLLLGGVLAAAGSGLRRWRGHGAALPLLAAVAVSAKAVVSSGVVTPFLYSLAPLLVALGVHLLIARALRSVARVRHRAAIDP